MAREAKKIDVGGGSNCQFHVGKSFLGKTILEVSGGKSEAGNHFWEVSLLGSFFGKFFLEVSF